MRRLAILLIAFLLSAAPAFADECALTVRHSRTHSDARVMKAAAQVSTIAQLRQRVLICEWTLVARPRMYLTPIERNGTSLIVLMITAGLSEIFSDEGRPGAIAHEFAHVSLGHLSGEKIPWERREPEADARAAEWVGVRAVLASIKERAEFEIAYVRARAARHELAGQEDVALWHKRQALLRIERLRQASQTQ